MFPAVEPSLSAVSCQALTLQANSPVVLLTPLSFTAGGM
jgi:hypothetical protein